MSSQAPKKLPQPLKKISIKQFQWYQVQTKVRELLTQLLQPFTKKQTEDTVKMNQLKRNLTSITKKIQDHDFLLTQQNAQKPTYIQLQDNKIQEIENKFIQLQISQNKKINDMQQILSIYENKIIQLNQIQTRIQQQIKQRNLSFRNHKQYIDGQIDLMLKKLDNQDNQINNLRQTSRNTFTKIQNKTSIVENRLIGVQDQLKRKNNDLKRLNDQIININEKLASTDILARQLQTRLSQRDKDYKLSQKFMAKAIQLQNSVSFVTNYLQFYQPLYTQMQISQTINSFLKGSMKTRACLFQQKIFSHMHYSILTMQQDTLQSKMADYSNRIRRIINRNKKYVIRMKIQQTLKYGNNTYQIREISQQNIQQSQQLTSKPPQIIIPQQQINKIIEQKWDKISQSVIQKINTQLQPIRIWLKQLQQQSLLRSVQIQKKSQQISQKLQKYEINIQLFKTQIKQKNKQLYKNLQEFGKQLRKCKEQIRDITHFSSVINHIVIQDQIDRQGLALYALKSSNTNNGGKGQANIQQAYPNIHIDQRCVSCQNGNASVIVNQAFKMACLAYNPSQIKVQGKVFTRQQILQISTNILDKLKKKLDDNYQGIDRRDINSSSNNYNIINGNRSNLQAKNRSKSLLSKQINSSRGGQYSTIDVPQSSRLKDTTYLLPTLGTIKKKSFATTNRQKLIN